MTLTLKRLWRMARPYPGQLVAITLLGLMMAAVAGMVPKLAEMFFKDVLEARNERYAIWIPYAFPALYAVNGLSRYLHFTRVRYLSEVLIANLRRDLLHKIQRLNLSFHTSFGSGSGGLMSRFLNDTVVLQEGLNHAVDLVREPVIAIALITRMLWLDWKLTIAALVFMPFLATMIRKVSRSLRKHGHKNREALEGLTSTIKESLDGVRVVQSFNLEGEMNRRFHSDTARYLETRKKIINREEGVSPMNEFIVSLIFMGFAFYAINEVFGGRSSPGELIAFLMAAGLLQMPVKKIQHAHVKLQQTVVVVDRLFEILESKSSVPTPTAPLPFPRNWQRIRFKNVGFSYGTEPVLRNIDIDINRGETMALVGESGSGKSTIVNMLERFFDPTEGEILIDDIPLSQIDIKDLRRNIALVTQDVFLFRDTVERNIHAGDFEKPSSGVRDAARHANAHEFIERAANGYQTHVGDRGGILSGGEKQRVSIARAIFKDAPLLILDEATSALDSVSELEVQKGLNRLMEGRTVFVIAHRLATIFAADRILVLKNGRIVEQGNHASLLERKGEYFNFFRLQTAGVSAIGGASDLKN